MMPPTEAPEVLARQVPAALESGIKRMLAGPDPSFALTADTSDLSAALAQAIADRSLAEDIAGMARLYAQRTAARRLAIRFDRVTGRGCNYFHVDYVDTRMIVTYAGAGTEYVCGDDADRSALGSGNNRRIVPDRSRVRRVPRFAAAFFPGVGSGRGVVHRSPAATRRNPRLVLVVDEADACD